MFGRNVFLVVLCVFGVAMAAAVNEPRHLENAPVSENAAICILFHEMVVHPAVLHRANLIPADEQSAGKIIYAFDNVFQRLGPMLHHGTISKDQFIQARDGMVEIARKQLAIQLSPAGSTQFAEYLRNERTHISITSQKPTEN